MAIITISKLLREAGLDISKKIKLVRHKDCRSSQIVDGIEKKGSPYDWYLHDRETFIAYQSEQGSRCLKALIILYHSLAKKELQPEWWEYTEFRS